jgi:hypothetical protein
MVAEDYMKLLGRMVRWRGTWELTLRPIEAMVGDTRYGEVLKDVEYLMKAIDVWKVLIE